MSFAKPKVIGNPARGRPGSTSTIRAQPVNSKRGTAQTRTPSVSSTSSRRSASEESIKDEAASIDVDSSSSRPPSVSSNRSITHEQDSRASNLPDPEPVEGTSSGKNTTPPEPSSSAAGPQPTSDPLQVAAQVYPWMYMTSTLDACFKTAESAAEQNIAARTKEVAEEESDLSDQRVRLDAERHVEFYQELSTDKFATTAPSIMQAFLSHGEACTVLESESLQLATIQRVPAEDDYSPMRPYNAILDRLEDLQRQNAQLHASIVALTQEDGSVDSMEEDIEQPSARSQMIHVFSACLPILQGRATNLQMAHELLEGAKENLAMTLHLESLEFSESEDDS